MSGTSDDEFSELDASLKEFARKRQSRLRSMKSAQQQANASQHVEQIPTELEYETLLKCAMAVLKKGKDQGESTRIKLPLDVKREARKTSINIVEIANILNRSVEHLVSFISNELMATGSVNKDGKLLIKGMFIRSEIQEVLRRYIEHFVVCKICENVEDTEIVREKRLYFLKCSKCGGARCVGNAVEGITTKGKAKPQLRGML
ncbi:subunit beta of translation initiation factor 2 [Ordospora colligata]|uniref:Subunit beta of translation initiation factor 2 n=1 Tax=Ordospora colligata OC4 TaxID=1354746 RepID=A0A0B2UJU3_9MICR|nr:subunit beta of translation initiation factor 2 [Ordospora colligata OC4]KHN69524.1 subunit beta of translation initiation factor 2 [Ordospora colligata OC4]TBU15344.1 subunit beta of translation initiation factor 2 [Ordospora colligata]TBU15444.1 subunit beta of translation initiation factor 2 [Ordospora colligata]TBU18540.1 subunit beta of translation initiation factor 2 [Ordospora colligata]